MSDIRSELSEKLDVEEMDAIENRKFITQNGIKTDFKPKEKPCKPKA